MTGLDTSPVTLNKAQLGFHSSSAPSDTQILPRSLSFSLQRRRCCRWKLDPPDDEWDWSLTISATRAAKAGEEALLLYQMTPSWDFFLHYGFVPPRNAEEEVVLFNSIKEAVAWFHNWVRPVVKFGTTEADGDLSPGDLLYPACMPHAVIKLPPPEARDM